MIMEQRVLLILAVICFQDTITAPVSYVPRLNVPHKNHLQTGSEEPKPNNAEFYQEFQRLKSSAEEFRRQIVNFTTVLSSQSQPGSALRSVIDDVINAATNRMISYIKNVETTGTEFLASATHSVGDQMRQGKQILDGKLGYAQRTVEGLQKTNDELFRNSISYLQRFENSLKANLLKDSPLALESGEDSNDPQGNEAINQHLQRRADMGAPEADSFVTEQMNGLRDSGAGVLRGVTALSTGTIIGILDALSSILTTTSAVSHQAKRALSSINRSGAHAVNSVIGTAGSFVSGTLDKTGLVIDSMRMTPQQHNNHKSDNNHDSVESVEASSHSQRALNLHMSPVPENLSDSGNESDVQSETNSQPRINETQEPDSLSRHVTGLNSSEDTSGNPENFENQPQNSENQPQNSENQPQNSENQPQNNEKQRYTEGSESQSQHSESQPQISDSQPQNSESQPQNSESHHQNSENHTRNSENHTQNSESQLQGMASQTGLESDDHAQLAHGSDGQPQEKPSPGAENEGPETTNSASKDQENSVNHAERQETSDNRTQSTDKTSAEADGPRPTENRDERSETADASSKKIEKSDLQTNRSESTNDQHQEPETLSNRTEKEDKVTGDHFQEPKTAESRSGESGAVDEQSSKKATSEGSLESHIPDQKAVDDHSEGEDESNKEEEKLKTSDSSSKNDTQEQQSAADRSEEPGTPNLILEPKISDSSPGNQIQDQRYQGDQSEETEKSNRQQSESETSDNASNNHVQEQKTSSDQSVEPHASDKQPSKSATLQPKNSGQHSQGAGTSPEEASASDNHSSVSENSDANTQESKGSESHPQEPVTSNNPSEKEPKMSETLDEHHQGQKTDDSSEKSSPTDNHTPRPETSDEPPGGSEASNNSSKESGPESPSGDDSKNTSISDGSAQGTIHEAQLDSGEKKSDNSEVNQLHKQENSPPSSERSDSTSNNTDDAEWPKRAHDKESHHDEEHNSTNTVDNNNINEKNNDDELISERGRAATTAELADEVENVESSGAGENANENLETGETSKDQNNNSTANI